MKRDMLAWAAMTQEIYATCDNEEEIDNIYEAMKKILELQRDSSKIYLEAGVLKILNK